MQHIYEAGSSTTIIVRCVAHFIVLFFTQQFVAKVKSKDDNRNVAGQKSILKFIAIMKTILGLCLLISFTSTAQPNVKDLPAEKKLSHEAIQDYYIGWEGGLSDPNLKVTGKTLNGRTYSAKQIDLSRKFIQWIQASYTPKGCIGIAKYFQNRNEDKYRSFGKGDFYYNQSLPQLFGAYAQTWQPIMKKANGTFVPIASEPFGERWNISANQLEFITTAVNAISSPNENFFIMPTYVPGKQDAAMYPYAVQNSSYLHFDTHPNLQNFQHFVIPRDLEMIEGRGLYVVIISKNNQPLPVEGITLGEFLTRLEKNLPVMYKDRYSSNRPSGAWETAQKNIALIKERYKNRANEEASIDPAFKLDFIDIINADKGILNMLEKRNGRPYFPVLRLKKGVVESSKNDTPQWVAVYWSMSLSDLPASVHMMESILNNFNFQYVYDYFYGNDKVIAPYKPLRPPLAISPFLQQDVAGSKETTAAAKDKNIFFFDDFSTVATDGYAKNWKTANDFRTGFYPKVKELNGSKWMQFTSHKATPNTGVLPADFNMSFKLAVTKGMPSTAQPLTIGFTDKDFFWGPSSGFNGLEIKLSPGNNGNPGNLLMDGGLGAGYTASGCEKENGRTYPYLKVPGFSNDKQLNVVEIQITRKGEMLQLFCGGTKIYECKKAIPATMKIKGVLFYGGENDDYRKNYYYISNVKIEKL